MEPIVIIVNGYPQSGKSTFCEFAEEAGYYTIDYSTVDTVKYIAKKMGWDGVKDNRSRDMLSALKDFYSEWFDGPYEEAIKIIREEILLNENYWVDFIFMHIREPKEIQKIVDFCDEEDVACVRVFIKRRIAAETAQNNHADANVEKGHYNVYIANNKDIDWFKESSLDFFTSLIDGSYTKRMKQTE